MRLLPDCRFSNIYGPAEVNQCAYYHVPAQIADTDEPIPIGQIWPNAEGMVVDKHDQVVSPGEVGELLIRTPTIMQGYWRRPDLNQRAFFYRQQAAGQQDVFYRTGDLVQLQPDGNYSFLGRKDRQVKSRGYRIELDEVEAALMSHEQVREAAVFPVPDNEGSHRIHAVVITKDDAFVKSSDLVKYLSSRLPRYAVPVRFQFTNGFPRTSSGKVDRRKLEAQALVAINA
jgi:acyl-coenzyme A synthetase/AMP-(fatty) acid ligase